MDLIVILKNLEIHPPEKRLRYFLPTLIGMDFFSHIENPKEENIYQYFQILEKLASLSNPLGFTLGVASVVLATIPAQILYSLGKKLNRWEEWLLFKEHGKVFAFAVSEKGWKGKLTNLNTNLTVHSNLNTYTLQGEKSIVTNGYDADFYLVVTKENPSATYPILLIPNSIPGLIVQRLNILSLPELTHAQLEFQNINLNPSHKLNLNYQDFIHVLPIWERFSLQYIGFEYIKQYLPVDSYKKTKNKMSQLTSKIVKEGIQNLTWKDTMYLSLLWKNTLIEIPGEEGKLIQLLLVQ